MASCSRRKVNIFLEEGYISEVKLSKDDTKKDGYVIVAEFYENKLVRLRLYNLEKRKFLEEYDTNEAIINAFEYGCSYKGNHDFSNELDTLREFFYINIGKIMPKEGKTEIKKFLYLVYLDAKKKRLL